MSEELLASAGVVDVAVLDDDIDFRNYIEDLLRDEGELESRRAEVARAARQRF